MSDNEQLIWSSFLEGNRHSLQQLYNNHYAALFNYSRRFSDNTSLLEECIQDLFVKLWLNKSNLTQPASVRIYLLKALRHIVYNKLSLAKKLLFVGAQEELLPFELSFTPLQHMAVAYHEEPGLSARMQKILQQLTPRQKESVYLIYFENLSYEEAAAVLGMTVKSTYKLVYRAIDQMKENAGIYISMFLSCLLQLQHVQKS